MSYYVTTPIYYVNGEPHLGHAYTTIAADVLARHMRQRGEDVFFLTGTDEHGEPVAQAAEKLGHHAARAGRQERRRASRSSRPRLERHQRLLHPHHRPRAHGEGRRGRAADPRQRPRLRGQLRGLLLPPLRRLQDRGRARARATAARSTRSSSSSRRRTTGSSGCPPSRSRSSGCTPTSPDFVTPAEPLQRGARVHQERTPGRVAQPRARLKWGVPVPWDESQVIYVWIDALLNYYTALSYARQGEDLTDKFWPATVHLIGKDILKFHAVIWPAMLMAAGIEVPEQGHDPRLPDDGEHKMSKSLGNVIEPVPRGRRLRPRRAALLRAARGQLRRRTARCRPRASRRATRPSSPTSTATSRAARWR